MANLSELMQVVRELSFDNFPAISFYMKAGTAERTVEVDSTGIIIKDSIGTTVESFLFSNYPTQQTLVDAIQDSNNPYIIASSPTFIGNEPSDALRKIAVKPLSDEPVSFSRKNYFSDSFIIREIVYEYLLGVFQIRPNQVPNDPADYLTYVENFASNLNRPLDKHFGLWVAYHVVEKRRMYEAAARQLDVTGVFSDEDASLIENFENANNLSVSIGDVFSLSTGPEMEDLNDQIHLAGIDNVFGDKNSFWYRLQLFLRLRFEYLFSDFSLRKDQVIQGKIHLEKRTNGYAYYDSWPYTLSPVSREILSGQ